MFQSFSTKSSGSGQSWYQDTSSSPSRKKRKRRGSSLAAIYTEAQDSTRAHSGLPGGLPTFSNSGSEDEDDDAEETIDVDAKSDKGTLENPLDNSPSVTMRSPYFLLSISDQSTY